MMIGASPGSCGGGIKTTTFAVLIGLIIARFQDRQQVRLFHRGIPESVISKAITIAFFGFLQSD
jgi:trk system potassium uptake protein